MKIRIFAIAALAALAVTPARADEHTVFDPVSRASMRAPLAVSRDGRIRANTNSPAVQVALVRLNPGADIDDLVADGFDAVPLRGGFAVVTCPASEAERLVAHKAVRLCEFNRQRSLKMDLARRSTGVDAVYAGEEIPSAYTGNGVITGIVDGGFDPNHINFKDAEGNSRFRNFSTVEVNTTGSGVRVVDYTPQQLKNYVTDDNTVTHGTHTLGIMAGGYRGEATVGHYDHDTGRAWVDRCANPYHGVAYDSKIYASSGASYDALIAYAIDNILEKRWYNDHDTPIVINLSLGGNNGPHDGSGALCQYIDYVTESDGAVICVSSGNEGDLPIALHKTMTDDDTHLRTFIFPFAYTDMRYGMVEIYSDSAQDFDVSVIVYNTARNRVARTFPMNNKEGQIQYICSSSAYSMADNDIIDATFAKAFEGYVGVGGYLDEESGRFMAAVDYYTINSDDNPANADTSSQYLIGFEITAHPGQRIDCFCDGTFTALDSYGIDGYTDGSRNGTISDIATAKKAIAVGSYNTREWASNIQGNLLGYDAYYKLNEVTEFSSFGELVDGRSLPHILAPGCTVVSSTSTPYMLNPANGDSEQYVAAKVNDGTRNHYFEPMMGTSMASPFVAGVVALMLEANPSLKADEVREILMQTAVVEPGFALVPDAVQYGAGRINAHDAVKAAARSNGITPVDLGDTGKTMFTSDGNGLWRVFVPSAARLAVDVYAIDGRRVMSVNSAGDETSVDLSGMSTGLYIINVNNTYSQRIAIR